MTERFSPSNFINFFNNTKSRSHPSMIALSPIVRIRQSTVLYPLNRSPLRYASRIFRSAPPSISLRTIERLPCYSIVATPDGQRIYYNNIRPHQGLNGKTPAQGRWTRIGLRHEQVGTADQESRNEGGESKHH